MLGKDTAAWRRIKHLLPDTFEESRARIDAGGAARNQLTKRHSQCAYGSCIDNLKTGLSTKKERGRGAGAFKFGRIQKTTRDVVFCIFYYRRLSCFGYKTRNTAVFIKGGRAFLKKMLSDTSLIMNLADATSAIDAKRFSRDVESVSRLS